MFAYQPKYFSPEELVPESVFRRFGERSYMLFNANYLESLDNIRENHGPIVVNTWHSPRLQRMVGGQIRSQAGLRTYQFYLGRAAGDHRNAVAMFDKSMSQHKLGAATDGLPMETPLADIQTDIRENHETKYPGIHGLEVSPAVTWLHTDGRNYGGLLVFRP